ncbi:MAG: UbiX family flavin prenyltransferase [Desulfurococcales archaeon]|nr:UbiX family flavin prenyltransferase [Desulfurococcales archaeon]
MNKEKIGLAITGASGVRVGVRVAEYLSGLGYSLEIVVTRGAMKVAEYEDEIEPGLFKEKLSQTGNVYDEDDYTSPLASSSSVPSTFIVAPASMKTVAKIALGISDNLVTRAALAVLRLGGTLVVAPRETPLGVAELRNILALAEMGARVVPLCVGFYHKPRSLDDVVDFLAGKILDAAGIENSLYRRWASRSP